MSGGRIVVVDRSGRDVKWFPLSSGIARVGQRAGCQVRVLQKAVRPVHATLMVRNAGTVIRSKPGCKTLVNGIPVSVAPLQHGDQITVGDRILRWEYDNGPHSSATAQPALSLSAPAVVVSASAGRTPRRSMPAPAPPHSPRLTHDIEMRHRASMPASAGGKQVAIVQPQRRDHSQDSGTESSSPSVSPRASRPRMARTESEMTASKADMWIESRKSGKHALTPKPAAVTPKQAPPKPNTPRKVSPRKSAKPSTAGETSALQRQNTPRQRSPRKSTTKNTPKEVTPQQSTARQSSAKKASPKQATPRKNSPNQASRTPLASTSKRVSPRQVTPRLPSLPISRSSIRRVTSAKKATPLRLTVLRKAQSAQKNKVMKIEAPLKIDLMKQAAIMRMTGHTPKGLSPSLLVKRPSPVQNRKSGVVKKSKSPRLSAGVNSSAVPTRASLRGGGDGISVFELTDTESQYSRSSTSQSRLSPMTSPLLPSPKKSALKDPKRSTRKTESIKFDLSNLESYHYDNMSVTTSDSTVGYTSMDTNASGDNTLLRYSMSPNKSRSPSPRQSIHSRSSRMLQQAGSPLRTSFKSRSLISPIFTANASTPILPKSPRSSALVEKALSVSPTNSRLSRISQNTTDQSITKTILDHTWDTTVESAFKSRTRSPRNVEAYSVVDLVSDSDNSKSALNSGSLYDSLGTTRSSSIAFGTPQTGRGTRSTIASEALTSSTPYVDRGRQRQSTRSNSSPNISTRNSSPKTSVSRRSQSLTTPENSRHVSVNSTKISHVSPNISTRNSSLKTSVSRRSQSLTTPENSRHVSVNSTKISHVSPNISTRNSSPKPSVSRRSQSLTTPENSRHVSVNSTKISHVSPNISTRNSSPKPSVSRRSQSLTTPENSRHVSVNSTKISRVSKSRSRLNGTELQLLDDTVEESPKSSRKSKPSKPNSPNVTNNSKRGSRRKLTVDVSLASSQGTVTPENQQSPEEMGTPVLSIQSLLNSSLSSLSQHSQRSSPNVKRRTIGVLRTQRKIQISPKSKSYTAASGSQRLRFSCPSTSSDKESTPTSAVKLVQEAVKNKHSTAKKPQSKRSIIDELNESAIVKQLFNSPVKRKLSQSMTEMSRNHLSDDEDPPITRNTINVTRSSPKIESVLDRSRQLAAERFVNSPGNSPRLSGIKKLFKKNSPNNDLRDVKGVRNLLRTHTRKSIRNDLTDISGVQEMFTTPPRNRRSVANVAKLITSSPNNSVEKRKGRSPRNDLTNISGVRDLFKRRSVKNDLRQVSGVKRTLAKSPNNDLRDVRGVKRIFAKETANNYSDLSGVEELFDQSQSVSRDSEILFDQLIGKPPVKAVYSKSYVTGAKPKKLRGRSLRKSIEIITNNVEEWLQQELNKSLNKKSSTKTNTSATDKVAKELQKLSTDTVEGNEIRTSRVRTSTVVTSLALEGARRSKLAYSARKLPIKKRSLVEASDSSGNNSSTSNLPIKKRAVIHSTPVRGTYDVTMNATEIRAMSPIAVVNVTRMDPYAQLRTPRKNSSQSPKHASAKKLVSPMKLMSPKKIVSPKQTRRRATKQNVTELKSNVDEQKSLPPRGRRTTKTKVNSEVTAVVASPRPKRATRGKIAAPKSPKPKPVRSQTPKNLAEVVLSPKPRGRRGAKAQNVVKQSPVLLEPKRQTKKASENIPILNESPKPKRGRNQRSKVSASIPIINESPEQKRGRNQTSKSIEAKTSPKKTRGKPKGSPTKNQTNTKRRRNSLVIGKKLPVPKPAKKLPQKAAAKPKTPKKTTRRQKASPKKAFQVKTPKAKRASLVIPKPSPKMKPQGAKRGRKPAAPKAVPKQKTPKAETKKQVQAPPGQSPEKPATKRGRRNAQVTQTILETTGARKSAKKVASPKTETGTKVGAQKSVPPMKTLKRGVHSQLSDELLPKRGRKANVTEPIKSPPKAKRGTKTEASPQRGRKRKAVDNLPAVPAKVAKNSPKPTRGRKQAKVDTPITQPTTIAPKNDKKLGPAAQTKAKSTKSPASAAKTVRGGAKAAKSPKVSKTTGPAAQTKAKSTKSPASAAKTVRGGAKAAKSPKVSKTTPAAQTKAKGSKSPADAPKTTRGGAKAAKSPDKLKTLAKGAKGATKVAKLPTKVAKSPVKRGANAKAVPAPTNKEKTTRSRKR